MTAASKALEARHEQNDVVFNSMERLLNMQVEQTANMQHDDRLASAPDLAASGAFHHER